VSGSPTLSLPCGVDRNGLPLGLQLVGPHLSEALLCRAGHAFQQATGFHTAHPVLQR
jgi:amidase